MENFKISWKNHENRQINSIAQLLFNDKFTDCTLAAEGKNIRAHKVILSSASTYFLELFSLVPDLNEPTMCIFMHTNYEDLYNLIRFIYTGEINLNFTNLNTFIDLGTKCKVQGLKDFHIDVFKTEKQNASGKLDSSSQPGTSGFNDSALSIKSIKRSISKTSMKSPKRLTRTRRISKEMKFREETNCQFCERKFFSRSTQKNHERFCSHNPDHVKSVCSICNKEVKPGSMTFHKKKYHDYVPVSRSVNLLKPKEEEEEQ